MPGSTMEDVVTARADYSKLDQKDAGVRLRLNSTAVHVTHVAAGARSEQRRFGGRRRREVEITYSRGGVLQSVRAKNCVLACYNMMIPYICPELPEKQKDAMAYLVKTPLVYTHVALRNWTSFSKLGVHQIVAPGGYHTLHGAGFSGEHRAVRVSERSGAADGFVHAADAVPSGTADARSVSRGARGVDGDAVCDVRTQYSRSVGADAGRSGI